MGHGYSAVKTQELHKDYLKTFPEWEQLQEILDRATSRLAGQEPFISDMVPEISEEEAYMLESYRDEHRVTAEDMFWKAMADSDQWDLADFNTEWEEAKAAWDKVREAFAAKHPTLYVGVARHDSDSEGSRYDEIDGVFFELYGAYDVTEEAKKIQNHWSDVSYVHFG